ncbi:hypothetical protein N7532_005444 [Penicillium argentinense]|uniref:DUF985 domain-containing protein n=1 Tax=Penicillium argentinense TaxID=1131581 RepID=A0A9W9K9Z0_9EURO|nr:uncharacterized protein N7532_005444 [Penicillium argentinense]KAJ5098443.1 hypothetical protein N7532_005444 [Penicillium argentinense]
MDIPLSHVKPVYTSSSHQEEDLSIQSLLSHLDLHPHPEGGYFAETHRNPLQIPNPFQQGSQGDSQDDETRSASTAIYYLLTPRFPVGVFHRNQAQTIHTLHRGRGRYVVIHSNPNSQDRTAKADIETFVVGPNLERGERMQWVVPGGMYKASFLLPDSPASDDRLTNIDGSSEDSTGLLISEVQIVVPGFEYTDNDFLHKDQMDDLLSPEQIRELAWLVK